MLQVVVRGIWPFLQVVESFSLNTSCMMPSTFDFGGNPLKWMPSFILWIRVRRSPMQSMAVTCWFCGFVWLAAGMYTVYLLMSNISRICLVSAAGVLVNTYT